MKIKKGSLLLVKSSRKGTYKAIALKDFDTENDEWYSVALAQEKPLNGFQTIAKWEEGDEVPCRRGLCTVELLEEPKEKTYIFTREVKRWGVEAGDYYNPRYHDIVGGAEKLLSDGVIEEEKDYE